MLMKKSRISNNAILIALIVLGILPRIILIGEMPGGINQDEAYATYEAYSILKTGMDSRGYVNPVYFVAWGSGMNALLTYILMPFVSLMGLNIMTPRIPMFIISCLTMPAFYGCMRRMFSNEIALLALFLLAISPWHIGLSRWALESNLAPAFLTFALYFFLRTLENAKFAPVCGLLYGLCLYCYAIMWVVVPLILVMNLMYAIWTGKIKTKDVYLYIIAGMIVFLFALPLILFMLINKDILPEIRTAYFSIPHLINGRIDEVSLSSIPANIYNTLRMLIIQADSDRLNSSPRFGLYYHVSNFFFPLGFIACWIHFFKRENGGYILFQFLACIPVGILVNVVVQRINGIYIPIIAMTAVGISIFVSWFHKYKNHVFTGLVCIYLLLFLRFEYHYFTDYGNQLNITFQAGLEEGMNRAKELAGSDTIFVSDSIYYPRILFYDKTDPELFQKTKEWISQNGDEKYQLPLYFDRWTYNKNDITDDTVCLLDIPTSYEEPFRSMEREEYEWIAVMKPKRSVKNE